MANLHIRSVTRIEIYVLPSLFITLWWWHTACAETCDHMYQN